MTDSLLWGLLACVLLPVWLLAGLVDYWSHQRTDIARTAGTPESRLHLLQTVEVGVPVLVVLFLELNLLALALLVAAAVAHTLTAWWDLRYASRHRPILPLEQVAHAFLLTLPLFATAVVLVLHWPVVQAPTDALSSMQGGWGLAWRDPPWPAGTIVVVLVASMLFGILPGLAEWWQVRQAADARGRQAVSPMAAGRGAQTR